MEYAAFIATSLDGFIADSEGRIDWLEEANARVPPGEDCGYNAFFATVDALIVGRKTFEQVLRFPEWPWGTKPVFVLSATLPALPPGVPPSVQLRNVPPAALDAECRDSGLRRAYVDGGVTIGAYLEAGFLDEITITTLPVLLGRGRALFQAHGGKRLLEWVSSRSWPFGFVQSVYRFGNHGRADGKPLPPPRNHPH
ncbi:MAG: dihydrofolate reductase family protein [Spirochaetes bacterium]|nr:dihydrofolate reductase family protein [Spirochaetota bacterium]